jgi:hypothetical protein
MQAAVKTTNWRRIAIVCAVLVVCGLAFWLLTRIPKTATIFIIAAFLASAVHPIVRSLESRIPRAWAIALVFGVLILLAAVCVVVVLPLTIAQSQLLAQNLPQYLQTGQAWSATLHRTLASHLPGVALPAHFFNLQQFSADRVTAIAASALASIGTVALNIATAAFIAISALILSVFMLLNHRQMAEGFAAFFPTRRRETAIRLAAQAAHVFGSYIVGQVVVSAITGVLIAAVRLADGLEGRDRNVRDRTDQRQRPGAEDHGQQRRRLADRRDVRRVCRRRALWPSGADSRYSGGCADQALVGIFRRAVAARTGGICRSGACTDAGGDARNAGHRVGKIAPRYIEFGALTPISSSTRPRIACVAAQSESRAKRRSRSSVRILHSV